MTKSRQAGTAWETAIVNRLREKPYGYEAERLRQSGADDCGDAVVKDEHGFIAIVEAKAEKAISLASYVDEAVKERDNYCRKRGLSPEDVLPVAIVKRRNKSVDKAYVVVPFDEFWR